MAQSESSKLSANMCPPRTELDSSKDTAAWLSGTTLQTQKRGRAQARPSGTFATPEVSRVKLFGSVGWLGGCNRLGGGRRPGAGGLRSRTGGRGRGHSGLRVVEVDHRIGHVHRFAPPHHRTLRPGLRRIHDHAESVVRRVLDEHWAELLNDPLGHLILLVLRILAGVSQLPAE